jgi:23S rRNA (pseudouridine1915-N3)-methyltransferase
MRLRVIALGQRMPAWVRAAWAEYAGRLPKEFSLELVELKAEARDQGRPISRVLALEGERVRREWAGDWVRVALDERGRHWTSRELAARLAEWRGGARPVAFAIGSADGLDPAIKAHADSMWALSALTLPHGLVRVILAEQIYRAVSLLSGHPYHRE